MPYKIIAILMSLLTAAAFLWAVLTPPALFNVIPHSIYTFISPNGAMEPTFILVFDVLTTLMLCFVLYKVILKLIVY